MNHADTGHSTNALTVCGPTRSQSLEREGWTLAPGLVEESVLERLRSDLDTASRYCEVARTRNGLPASVVGTAHHILRPQTAFVDFLRMAPLDDMLRAYFGGPYILNSFGGVLAERVTHAYVQQVHRDVRTYTRELKLMINMLVMLDDFRPENGATWLLPRSHREQKRPTEDEFARDALQLTGDAGSVVLFDSNVWHAAGRNTSGARRWALTLTFSRPFMKPQFDYLAAFSDHLDESTDPHLAQILGYYARVPATLDAWYQPPEERAYRPGQG